MSIIIVCASIWLASKLIGAVYHRAKDKAAQRDRERLREEHRRLREEQRQMREAQREQAKRQTEHAIALERARVEREELRREQEKQADEIAKLRHTIDQAQFDIDYLLERIGSIDTQTDYYIYLQSATVPGGDEWCKHQRRIDTLKSQAHAAETRLSKARFTKAQAQRKLA